MTKDNLELMNSYIDTLHEKVLAKKRAIRQEIEKQFKEHEKKHKQQWEKDLAVGRCSICHEYMKILWRYPK